VRLARKAKAAEAVAATENYVRYPVAFYHSVVESVYELYNEARGLDELPANVDSVWRTGRLNGVGELNEAWLSPIKNQPQADGPSRFLLAVSAEDRATLPVDRVSAVAELRRV
jgi:hypothetical protein